MKRMRFEKLKGKMQKFRAIAIITGLFIILAACGKQEEKRPTSVESPKPPAPFSRGPTGPPKVSAPTYPPPGQ